MENLGKPSKEIADKCANTIVQVNGFPRKKARLQFGFIFWTCKKCRGTGLRPTGRSRCTKCLGEKYFWRNANFGDFNVQVSNSGTIMMALHPELVAAGCDVMLLNNPDESYDIESRAPLYVERDFSTFST